jgi:two-component system OmpR family response regulator
MAGQVAGETILIVDDDSALRELIGDFLQGHGYAVKQAGDVPAMRGVLAGGQPDLIILDLMMPGEDGLAALRTLDAVQRPPVIMLSAMGSDVDRIIGLEMGADDYLPKPCNPRELLARIRAVLRRGVSADDAPAFLFGGWRLDTSTRELTTPGGTPLAVTPGELRMLEVFVRAGRRVLAREELATRLGGPDYEAFDRAIDLTISRLRRKLAAHDPSELIRTVRGEGYGLNPPVTRV